MEEESEAERLNEPAVTRSACGAVAEGEGLLIVAFICDIVDDQCALNELDNEGSAIMNVCKIISR